MPPYPNSFLPSKKTRDFGVADTVIAMSNARLEVVTAGNTTIGPDTLVLLDTTNPDAVTEALSGTPVVGTDTIMGTTTTYSNQTAVADGVVGVAKLLPGMSFRVQLNTPLLNQAAVDAIIGNQYFIASSVDADGFIHQELDNSVATDPTAMIRVVDADFVTDVALCEIVA